jgi:hypothetical protein
METTGQMGEGRLMAEVEGPDAGIFTADRWDGLHGATEAEHAMHAIARAALMKLLLTDPMVINLFDRWNRETRLGCLATALANHMDKTAQLAGLASRRVLAEESTLHLKVEADTVTEADTMLCEIERGIDETERLAEELLEALDDRSVPPFDDVVDLVRDIWGLRWPWIAAELYRAWLLSIGGTVFCQHFEITYHAHVFGWDRPAPEIDVRFATRQGETIADASERFLREIQTAVIVPLKEAAAPLPRGRLTDQETAERYVGWWYRQKIRRESIRSIADKQDDRRRLVRHGIAQAERWLAVSNRVWETYAV